MRYAQIRPMDISNGEGIGVSLFVQGCPIHCPGCFQPETWDFKSGELFTGKIQQKILKLIDKPYISRFSVLGGEPLWENNWYVLYELLYAVKKIYPNKKIWLWTGYTWDYLQKHRNDEWAEGICLKNILNKIDYLITGPFIQEEKDLTLRWRGSRNQEVIDMQATIKKGEKVLYVTN